ncbi:hypothetical protein [Brevibacterium aurantiacum]|uniref:hypothetical protein n=1 Tax=Brevibacterium aurantiacum TaxID=273384 RepID=UPI00105448BC|nr:hypothetical protein [Brevibacterium aurantiacum]MDN5585198.1 hypothetical protein [Brevibacterium sp.]
MSYMPIHFNGSAPHYQDVLNSHKARRRPDRPKIPVLARLIWENDGEQWCHGHALRLDPGVAIFVELRDPRCRSTGVWLSPNDVIWPGKF